MPSVSNTTWDTSSNREIPAWRTAAATSSRPMRHRAIAFGQALAVGLRNRIGRDDRGMTTVEYAVGTLVAAALAAVLYRIVTGDSIVKGLTSLITRALGIV